MEERTEISMKTHRLTAVVSVVSYFERSASRPLALIPTLPGVDRNIGSYLKSAFHGKRVMRH